MAASILAKNSRRGSVVDVARGDCDGLDAALVAGIGGVHRVFGKDYRVVVGERNALAALFYCGARDGFRRGLVGELVEAARFGDVPVLAELAGEVAACSAERQDAAAGVEMVERLLLDWVDAEARGAPVGGEHNLIIGAAAHETCAALSFVQFAVARAQVALDAPVIQQVPVLGRILFGDADRLVHLCFRGQRASLHLVTV